MARTSSIERHVVTKGDLPMASPGPLYTCPKKGKDVFYNVAPGQLVAFTEEVGSIPYIVNCTTLEATSTSSISIGVGIDTNGNGAANELRLIGTDDISGCNLDSASASGPACGTPEVKDFFFDCTKCNETYSLKVTYDDNSTRSYAPAYKSAAEVVGSVVTECHSCNDCAPEHNCKEVACKLVDAINNDRDLKVGDKLYPDWKQGNGVKPPFRAVRLHERSLVYCISPKSIDCSCDTCNVVDAITGFTVKGVSTALTGNLSPTDNSKTLVAQLESIACQIEDAFETEIGPHAGSAYITKGTGNCCAIQLHINTCDLDFAIDGLEPCVDENPFKEYTKDPTCVDCDTTPNTYGFECGIRIIADPVEFECGCYMEQPKAFMGRKIEISAVGEGWHVGSTKVENVQDFAFPAGQGSQIQWQEYRQMPGGSGRNYRASRIGQGWMNLPSKDSRINSPMAKCKEVYCTYELNSHKNTMNQFNEHTRRNSISSKIHIPYGDDTTKVDFEKFFNILIGLNPGCNKIGPVTCEEAGSGSGSGASGTGAGAGTE